MTFLKLIVKVLSFSIVDNHESGRAGLEDMDFVGPE